MFKKHMFVVLTAFGLLLLLVFYWRPIDAVAVKRRLDRCQTSQEEEAVFRSLHATAVGYGVELFDNQGQELDNGEYKRATRIVIIWPGDPSIEGTRIEHDAIDASNLILLIGE
ncbi:MAG: hypothetical protein WD768_09925 [Phycisphaeraceae bacterium]